MLPEVLPNHPRIPQNRCPMLGMKSIMRSIGTPFVTLLLVPLFSFPTSLEATLFSVQCNCTRTSRCEVVGFFRPLRPKSKGVEGIMSCLKPPVTKIHFYWFSSLSYSQNLVQASTGHGIHEGEAENFASGEAP